MSSAALFCGLFIFISVLIITIVLLVVSIERLESTEYGIQYNTKRKTLNDAIKTGGLHTGPPGFEFIKFPSTFITEDLPDGTCVSQDGLRVDFSVTFQYDIPKEWLIPCALKYRNFDEWADFVSAAAVSAIQHSCAEFTIFNFQNKRGIIQSRMEQNLKLKLEGTETDISKHNGVYARAISLQLRNVELPDDYNEAVREKQSAAEDISLAKNQRQQETTKAKTELLKAEQEARKILDSAMNDANITLALAQLEARETLFDFEKEAEVILKAKTSLKLTTAGVLSYMANRLVAKAPKLHVLTEEPAQLSRKDDL